MKISIVSIEKGEREEKHDTKEREEREDKDTSRFRFLSTSREKLCSLLCYELNHLTIIATCVQGNTGFSKLVSFEDRIMSVASGMTQPVCRCSSYNLNECDKCFFIYRVRAASPLRDPARPLRSCCSELRRLKHWWVVLFLSDLLQRGLSHCLLKVDWPEKHEAVVSFYRWWVNVWAG